MSVSKEVRCRVTARLAEVADSSSEDMVFEAMEKIDFDGHRSITNGQVSLVFEKEVIGSQFFGSVGVALTRLASGKSIAYITESSIQSDVMNKPASDPATYFKAATVFIAKLEGEANRGLKLLNKWTGSVPKR